MFKRLRRILKVHVTWKICLKKKNSAKSQKKSVTKKYRMKVCIVYVIGNNLLYPNFSFDPGLLDIFTVYVYLHTVHRTSKRTFFIKWFIFAIMMQFNSDDKCQSRKWGYCNKLHPSFKHSKLNLLSMHQPINK